MLNMEKPGIRNKIPWSSLFLIYSTHYFVVLTSTYFGQNILARGSKALPLWKTVSSGLSRWDGVWYLRIAEQGYTSKSAAFFPLYPMLIKGLRALGLDPVVAGLLISAISFFLVLVVLYALLAQDFTREVTLTSLWYLALFPTAYYFSALYTESLFLLLVVLSLYLARQGLWMWCGLCVALASLTRSLGVLLLIPVGYELWLSIKTTFQQSFVSQITLQQLLSFLPVPTVICVYMYYLWSHLGNALAFITAQGYWKREVAFPWTSLLRTLEVLHRGNNFWNLVFSLMALALLLLGVRMLRPAFSLYSFWGLLIPLSTPALHSPLLSLPRFVLVLFPCYLVLALLTKWEVIRTVILVISTTGLIYFTILYSTGHWVA